MQEAADLAAKGQMDRALDLFLGARIGTDWRDRFSRPRLGAIRRSAGNLAPLLAGSTSGAIDPQALERSRHARSCCSSRMNAEVLERMTVETLASLLPRARITTMPRQPNEQLASELGVDGGDREGAIGSRSAHVCFLLGCRRQTREHRSCQAMNPKKERSMSQFGRVRADQRGANARLNRRSLLRAAAVAGVVPATATLGGLTSVSAASPLRSQADPATLTIAMNGSPSDLDPHSAYDYRSAMPLRGPYEGLIALDGSATDKYVPVLAESWEPNDDKSVWTFTIRSGVTFHDGTPVDAEAVRASFERFLTMGLGPAGALRRFIQDPAQITAPDASTVVFDCGEPQPLLEALPHRQYGPLIVNVDRRQAERGTTATRATPGCSSTRKGWAPAPTESSISSRSSSWSWSATTTTGAAGKATTSTGSSSA